MVNWTRLCDVKIDAIKVTSASAKNIISKKCFFASKHTKPLNMKYADTITNTKSIITPKSKDKSPVLSKI